MNYIYHSAPEPMIGTKLVPLNNMKGSLQNTRSLHLKKYKDREEILQRRIPLLNCVWNDVIHFLPLHPQKVFKLQRDLHIIQQMPEYKFFEIPLSSLDPDKTVVYFKTAPGEENTEVKWAKDVDFAAIQQIPEATINYYKSLVGTGEWPFNYQFIPHVLYRGDVDVSNVKIIALRST